MLAVVYIRPGEVVRASILRLALLWILGPVLLLRLGGVGACFAILAATTGYAIALAWRMRRAVSYSFQRWGMALALGGIFVPLIWLRGAWWINAGLFALFLAIYAGLLMALRLVGVDEIKAALQVLRRRPETRLAKTPPSF
jgi:peptidoglycan biosynthesis protein MviN/MurJ (putative lipid II flippase)